MHATAVSHFKMLSVEAALMPATSIEESVTEADLLVNRSDATSV